MNPTWQSPDGTIRLYFGDCLEVLPQIDLQAVDCVLTDPPYGIVNQFGTCVHQPGKGTRTMQFGWDTPQVTANVLQALSLVYSRCSRRCGTFVFCGGDQFGGVLEVVRESAFTAKPAVWVKECPPPAGKGNWWPSGFEFAVYGYRNSPYFADDDTKRSNVFVYDTYRYGQPGKVDHPTQKPLKFIQRLVSSLVSPEGCCLDMFHGSGTTGVACARLGRAFIGIEREREYFDLAVSRIEAELNRAPLFETPPPLAIQQSLVLE